MNNAVINQKS